jgi:hypothetical protein
VLDDQVQRAWGQVTENWSDVARHDELFALVVKDNCFAWAAARYRERGDDPIAKEQLERLRKAALASMMVSAAKRETKGKTPYVSSVIVLVCLIVAMLIALFVTKSLRDNRPHATQPARH